MITILWEKYMNTNLSELFTRLHMYHNIYFLIFESLWSLMLRFRYRVADGISKQLIFYCAISIIIQSLHIIVKFDNTWPNMCMKHLIHKLTLKLVIYLITQKCHNYSHSTCVCKPIGSTYRIWIWNCKINPVRVGKQLARAGILSQDLFVQYNPYNFLNADALPPLHSLPVYPFTNLWKETWCYWFHM